MDSSIMTVALFGEAEKGRFHQPHFLQNLSQVVDSLGNPPMNSSGIYYAVQILMYHRNLLFFRVREEGYSIEDYMEGLFLLKNRNLTPSLAAVCIPGVGDSEIFQALTPICAIYHSVIVASEPDLYDYLTEM